MDAALHCAARASSTYNPHFAVERALEGGADPRAFWRSADRVDDVWVQLDLGTKFALQRVELHWRSCFAAKLYELEASEEGRQWFRVHRAVARPPQGPADALVPAGEEHITAAYDSPGPFFGPRVLPGPFHEGSPGLFEEGSPGLVEEGSPSPFEGPRVPSVVGPRVPPVRLRSTWPPPDILHRSQTHTKPQQHMTHSRPQQHMTHTRPQQTHSRPQQHMTHTRPQQTHTRPQQHMTHQTPSRRTPDPQQHMTRPQQHMTAAHHSPRPRPAWTRVTLQGPPTPTAPPPRLGYSSKRLNASQILVSPTHGAESVTAERGKGLDPPPQYRGKGLDSVPGLTGRSLV